MKIYITESFHTQIIKDSIEFDPTRFPELEGMNEEQILDYLNQNSSDMYLSEEDEQNDWSLYDVLTEQNTEREKEKNYETHIHVDND
jgi:hypothetical protein